MKFTKIVIDAQMKKIFEAQPVKDIEAYVTECGVGVLKSMDNTPKNGWLKHVSISRPDCYPSWGEILEVKERFFGDIDVCMIMPKKEDYINCHKNCFHLWQLPERWGIR